MSSLLSSCYCFGAKSARLTNLDARFQSAKKRSNMFIETGCEKKGFSAPTPVARALATVNKLKIHAGAPHGLAYTYKDHLNADLLAFLKERG